MKTDRKPSSFLAVARLASVLAAVVAFADAANADPRPGGIWGNPPPAKPTMQEMLKSNVRYATKVGTQSAIQTPLKNAAVTKVPCAACAYRPPMLVRAGKFGK